MITLISRDPQCYYRGFHPVGETFTVTDPAHAQTLKALGRATDAPPAEPQTPKRTYRRRNMTAEDTDA